VKKGNEKRLNDDHLVLSVLYTSVLDEKTFRGWEKVGEIAYSNSLVIFWNLGYYHLLYEDLLPYD
jgi:hypothetical protein